MVSGPTKSPLALHTHNQADRPPMRPGTHVQASLLVTSTNHVKAQDIIVHPNNKHIDITKLLADLHKLKRGEKLKTPIRVGPTEKVEDENPRIKEVRNAPKESKDKEEASREDAHQLHEEEEQDAEVLGRRERQLDTFKRSTDYRFSTVFQIDRILGPGYKSNLFNINKGKFKTAWFLMRHETSEIPTC